MEYAEYIKTPKVEDVLYYGPDEPYNGALCLTGHHTILYANDPSRKEVWILHKNVDSVEKRQGQDEGLLSIYCKDFTQNQFQIHGIENINNICSSIETLASVTDANFLYAMFYRCKSELTVDGWKLYSSDEEFANVCSKSDSWRISGVNNNYEICTTYPRKIIVPKSIEDATLRKSSYFRHGGRIPVLSYVHTNAVPLLRCSQPLLGTGNRRCREDEKLLNACLGKAGRGYILDLRSLQSAQQARTKGGGLELDSHYPRWKRTHYGLQSFSILQESVTKLTEATHDMTSSMEKWLSKLESSGWLNHVKETLALACLAAQCIDKD